MGQASSTSGNRIMAVHNYRKHRLRDREAYARSASMEKGKRCGARARIQMNWDQAPNRPLRILMVSRLGPYAFGTT
jgi:hypothetical protein